MNNELTAALLTIEKCRELSCCPAGVDLQDWVKQLAAENVALKTFCKNAAFDADYEAELGMERGGFTDALNNIETPATDRIVAEAEARGIEKGIAHLENKFSNIGVQIMNLQWLADSLREGADK